MLKAKSYFVKIDDMSTESSSFPSAETFLQISKTELFTISPFDNQHSDHPTSESHCFSNEILAKTFCSKVTQNILLLDFSAYYVVLLEKFAVFFKRQNFFY